MKTLLILATALLQYPATAMIHSSVTADNPLYHIQNPVSATPDQPVICDPLRVVNGTNMVVTPPVWQSFHGRVLEVQPGGVRLENSLGNEFFVADFPYTVAENEWVGIGDQHLYALPAGVYTYPTAIGGSRTIRKMEYGVIYVPPPPTPAQIAAAQKAAADKLAREKAKAAEGAARALKLNQDAAAAGDAYGLMRMGERYRDGDGVAKDFDKAREYLTRAVAAGSPGAQRELEAMLKAKG
jgi:hypothetical protein